jgi:hypothetical protein
MRETSIVADGWERARCAVEATFRAEVTQEYATRLETASSSELTELLCEMEREIERRVAAKAPLWGLY